MGCAPYSPTLLERMNRDLALDPAPARAALGVECRPFRPEFPRPFDNELDGVLSRCLDGSRKEELYSLSVNAKAAAKGVEIYSRERGAGSYETIRAALALAVAVWGVEKERR